MKLPIIKIYKHSYDKFERGFYYVGLIGWYSFGYRTKTRRLSILIPRITL